MNATVVLIRSDIDLRDNPQARPYQKQEVVTVRFASQAGAIQSREGLNHYAISDALIMGSTGDHWSVSRARFDAKYLPIAPTQVGQDGQYRNQPVPILAVQQSRDFSVERCAGGDIIHGRSGDWLMQYAPDDHGIVENAKFQRVYYLLTNTP